MHKAKALQTAVFTLVDVTPNSPVTIHNTDITVGVKSGNYWVKHDGKEVKFLDRDRAIALIQRILAD